MGQHGTPFVRNVKDVAVTFQALLVFERSVGMFPLDLMIVRFRSLHEMDEDILDAVGRFGIEKIDGIVGGGEVTIHTIRHEPLGVIDMGGRPPGVVCELDFMTRCTKLGCRGPNHRIIRQTEKGKSDKDSHDDENSARDPFFHGGSPSFQKGASARRSPMLNAP